MLNGKHLIAGEWVQGDETFESSPSSGPKNSFSVGTVAHVEAAAKAAEEAFYSYSQTSRKQRANFLRLIASEIDLLGDKITEIAHQETGLPEARLVGERGRTTGQLNVFADHIEKGEYLDQRHDAALPEREPLPRPELRLIQRPIGPVAVFGASNFPLAFSTAGGDTASALAAGCPVVVKAHSAHPGTSDLVAQAVDNAIKKSDLHPGVFSQIQGGNRAVGTGLVTHPLIKAVGFTGSLGGGRALFDLCASRPEPIPFFGELGSVNPMFVLDGSISEDVQALADGWTASLTMGAGQFCTNPGIVVLNKGENADAFIERAKSNLVDVASQTMLTDGIAESYRDGRDKISATEGVREVLRTSCDLRQATPYLYETSARTWLENETLGHEVFGPLGMIVTTESADEMHEFAEALEGQLTCTVHCSSADKETTKSLVPLLERKAGRVLFNGYPTGVEVADSMVHGGPYPASTNFGATSVGTLAIRRFLRPVCYQNLPDFLIEGDLDF